MGVHMARWKPLATLVAVALLAAGPGVLAQTAPRPKPPARNTTPYPDFVRVNFMTACTADGKLTEALCGCVYRNLEREMTLEEFQVMDKKAMDDPNADPPQNTIDIAMACYANNNY
ncbi:MAG: hypothetical protein JWR84_1262 [Caulobacter sp.]|nr:hypothetical protein [Caulobacter sp.]